MNILLSFLQDSLEAPYAIPAYRFWSHYIKNGIEEAGMKWTEVPGVDWAAGLVPYENDPALQIWKAETWEKTLAYIKAHRHQLDIFLCYLYPKQIDIAAIKQIRDLGLPCVNFYCDHVRSYTRLPAEFKVFDLMWVPEFEALPMYRKAGISYINLPMPMWVAPMYRNCPAKELDIISFIGSKDSLRASLLSDAVAKGLQVQIRGNGWIDIQPGAVSQASKNLSAKLINQLSLIRNKGIKGMIAYHLNQHNTEHTSIPSGYIFEKPDFEAYINLSRESSITLGINRVRAFHALHKRTLTYSRLRDLEAPMLGACYLTEYTEGLRELYDLGIEIETYKTTDELIDKCHELLSSKTKRKELRIKGQQKALYSHSIPQSLQKIKQRLFK